MIESNRNQCIKPKVQINVTTIKDNKEERPLASLFVISKFRIRDLEKDFGIKKT